MRGNDTEDFQRTIQLITPKRATKKSKNIQGCTATASRARDTNRLVISTMWYVKQSPKYVLFRMLPKPASVIAAPFIFLLGANKLDINENICLRPSFIALDEPLMGSWIDDVVVPSAISPPSYAAKASALHKSVAA